MPDRIQLKRTKGWRKPEDAVVVSRPSKWGNPWSVRDNVEPPWRPEDVVRMYRHLFDGSPVLREQARAELAGCDLACWCPLDRPCHADVLLEIANGV